MYLTNWGYGCKRQNYKRRLRPEGFKQRVFAFISAIAAFFSGRIFLVFRRYGSILQLKQQPPQGLTRI
ncbi:unnamed protein product [Citrullus colocynthis]|uniref:Uncharacterized protein n=1 Tax=Citrullus colocynthis TaxID=252529 RepID=A0ABP0XMP2_9ROSI